MKKLSERADVCQSGSSCCGEPLAECQLADGESHFLLYGDELARKSCSGKIVEVFPNCLSEKDVLRFTDKIWGLLDKKETEEPCL